MVAKYEPLGINKGKPELSKSDKVSIGLLYLIVTRVDKRFDL